LGTTFLKQALIDLLDDTTVLSAPVGDNYDEVTAPLWDFMDALTPTLWRQGKAYPQTGPRQLQLIADNEVDLAISFSPGEASAAIANFQLPDTARTFVLDKGTLGNASFVAIPYNSGSSEGAMVVANFLMSAEAQTRAQNPDILGYGTVLNMDALSTDERAAFDALDLGVPLCRQRNWAQPCRNHTQAGLHVWLMIGPRVTVLRNKYGVDDLS
jgi:putative thiamine transport system substrate-binding protein